MHELATGHTSRRIGLSFRKCEGRKRVPIETADALNGADPNHATPVNGHAPDIAADQAVLFAVTLK